MYDKIKIHRLLMVLLLTLFSMQIHSQKNKQITFTLQEYKIKDINFYNELSTVLFLDTVFGTKAYLEWHTKILHNRFYFVMHYDTNAVHVDYETEGIFSANFNICKLIGKGDILSMIKNGKGIIGYFYIMNKNMICFISDSTHSDFVQQYLISTNKKRKFTFSESSDFLYIGGFTDVYMNILPNNKIEIIRVFRDE